MSFSDTKRTGKLALGALLVAAGLAAGCTIKPLYGENRLSRAGSVLGNAPGNLQAELASVGIDAPKNRFDQIVRNRLIYLLAGGAGEPAAPRYRLTLNSGYNVQQALQVNVGDNTQREGRASSGTVIAFADYQLKQGDKQIQRRKRSVTSSFDRPRQEYANLQAEEDAKKRAAEELAESIYLSLAQSLAGGAKTGAGK